MPPVAEKSVLIGCFGGENIEFKYGSDTKCLEVKQYLHSKGYFPPNEQLLRSGGVHIFGDDELLDECLKGCGLMDMRPIDACREKYLAILKPLEGKGYPVFKRALAEHFKQYVIEDLLQFYEACGDVACLKHHYERVCDALTLLQKKITSLEKPNEPDQLASYIDSTSGLRRLDTMMKYHKDTAVRHVEYFQGLPHVCSGIGIYQINIEQEARTSNLLIIHSEEEDMPDTATCPVDVPEPQVASSQDVATTVVEQNEPHNIFGEEWTFVVRVWDMRDGSEDDVVGSTVITIAIERSGMTLCVDLVGKLREDGYITTDDIDAIVFFGATPLVGFDAMRPLSYFGITRGSIFDIKIYTEGGDKVRHVRESAVVPEDDFVSGVESKEEDFYDYTYFLDEINQTSLMVPTTINIRLGVVSFPIRTVSNALWSKIAKHFFISAGVSKNHFDDFIFRVGENTIETWDGGFSLENLDLVDGSVVYASLRGSGGGKVGIKPKKDILKEKKMEKFKGMIEKVKGETTFDIEVQNVLSIPPETFISQAISFLNVEQLNAVLKVQSEEIEHGECIVKKIAPLIVPLIAGMKEQVVKYEKGMISMEHAVMMAFVQKYWDGKFNLSSFFQEVSNRMVALNTRAEVMAQMAQGYGTDTSMTG